MRKQVLTSFEAAKYCGADPHSVRNWILAGKLKAYTTPGGHRRILRGDLDAFLKAHGMPVPSHAREGHLRLLLAVKPDELDLELRSLQSAGWSLEVRRAANAFALGWELIAFRPHLLLLALDYPGVAVREVLRRVANSAETSGCATVAIARKLSVETAELASWGNARGVLGRPVGAEALGRLFAETFPPAAP